MSRTASCSCGQLRIQVESDPRGVGICNCLACQQRTGSVFAALARFAAPFKVFGTATEYARSGCYNLNAGTTVDLLLVVESSGRISAAYTGTESKKAKCFRKAYVGAKMPIPPFSPFPLRMRVR